MEHFPFLRYSDFFLTWMSVIFYQVLILLIHVRKEIDLFIIMDYFRFLKELDFPGFQMAALDRTLSLPDVSKIEKWGNAF